MIKVELFLNSSVNTDKLAEPLARIGVKSISSMDMKIFGSESKSKTSYRGVLRSNKNLHKAKLEIILPSASKEMLLNLFKEILGPEESLTTPVFITPMQPVESLYDTVAAS